MSKVYKGIGPNEGKIVPESVALAYVFERVGVKMVNLVAPEYEEFCEMLVEWYFSGEWIKEGADG